MNSLVSMLLALGVGCVGPNDATEADSDDVASAQSALTSERSCGVGSRYHPELGTCARVHSSGQLDRVHERPQHEGPPSLLEKRRERQQRTSRSGVGLASQTQSQLLVPGGLGAGVSYQSGQLSARESATLYTHMVIYPEGIGALPDWLFTTSTNRTEKGVEVVGIYLSAGEGSIGVFDWSCSTDDPCENDVVSPSWIWTRPFASDTCQYAKQADGAGVEHDAMYYANSTRLVSGRWHNEVTFWNYCTDSWDLVYSHEYGGTQPDCSETGCGWWGPIIENFFDLSGTTPIPELGFFDTLLEHDGQTSLLTPSETNWSSPPSNWNVCYREPNHSWGTTNQSCPTPSDDLSLSTQMLSDWDAGYCVMVTLSNTGTSDVSAWAARLDLHQSTLANPWSANFDLQSDATYRITPYDWNARIPVGGNVNFGFCANKNGADYRPSLTLVE